MHFLHNLWEQLYQDYETRLDVRSWSLFLQKVVDSLLVVVLAMLAIALLRRFINRIVSRADAIRSSQYRRRVETIASLAHSTFKYTVYIAAILWILTLWNVDKSTLVAGTAVVGAAIGFGSQGLIQDLITGLSLLAEEQLAVGDYVEINGKAGAVEEIGLRVVKLRDQLGAQHVIFNRTIGMVSNFTTGGVPATVDIALENEAASSAAKDVAARVCADLARELPYFREVPKVEGVTHSSTGDIFLRIRLRVLPQQTDVIQTLFVERLKRAFAAEKIAIPGERVRVMILSDLFQKAMDRTRAAAALPATGIPPSPPPQAQAPNTSL